MSRQADWNKAHYDTLMTKVKKGFREEIKKMAAEQGYSLSEYIRHALITQAKNDGYGDISAKIGGGGTLTLNAFRRLAERF